MTIIFQCDSLVLHSSCIDVIKNIRPQVNEFGVNDVRDLVPNGRNIIVSEETKLEYIRLVCQMKMTGAIRKQ